MMKISDQVIGEAVAGDPLRPQVVCLGELLIDFVSTTLDVGIGDCPSFVKAPGGAPANVAAGLAKLGVPSGFIGKVGADPFGGFLRKSLEVVGVNTEFLLSEPNARTTLAFVATRRDGKKEILFYRNPGADFLLRKEELSAEYISHARLFHYGSISLTHSPAREATLFAIHTAREAGLLISYDPNLRPPLWDSLEECRQRIWEVMPFAHVVKLAEEEWEFITGTSDFAAGSAKILDMGVALVVMTCGERGCRFTNGRVSGELPAFSVEVVDPLGAGDGFVAGMLSQMLNVTDVGALSAADLEEILRYASAAGALTTQAMGVIPALPTAQQVEEFLQNR